MADGVESPALVFDRLDERAKVEGHGSAVETSAGSLGGDGAGEHSLALCESGRGQIDNRACFGFGEQLLLHGGLPGFTCLSSCHSWLKVWRGELGRRLACGA